jgi:hypothetical protein
MALDSALIAISTMTRKAKVASCSMVRSRPMAMAARSCGSFAAAAPPYSRKSGLAGRDEIADAARQFDDSPVRSASCLSVSRLTASTIADLRRWNISCAGSPSAGRAGVGMYRPELDRVDLVDDAQPRLAEIPDDADRPQQPLRIVHEIEKGADRESG